MRGRCLVSAKFQCQEEKNTPMLVPLSMAVSVLLVIPTLNTSIPGAKISTPGPKLENDAFVSPAPMAPTVIAEGADAGESFAAFCLLWVSRNLSQAEVKLYILITRSDDYSYPNPCQTSNRGVYCGRFRSTK